LPTFWKSAVLMLSIAASVTSASAQNHPMPGAVPDPPVICTGCPGTNSVGEPNDGQPTFPYDTPISLHAGRFVDSTNTVSVQSPIRTIRSGLVRVAPASRNRIYLQLGGMVGAYTLDTFFSGKLAQPIVALNSIFSFSSLRGRNQFEKLAKPDQFFYAERGNSGWNCPLFDAQDVLTDFDTDDRGYLYISTFNFGWGIASDPGADDFSHLPFVAQVPYTGFHAFTRMLSLQNGANYYVYGSDGEFEAKLYDVTTAAIPALDGTRSGSTKAFTAWSKYEAGQRVALINFDGHARIYNHADLIANGTPLADLTPSAGKIFIDLSFDEDGNLWLAESTWSTSSNLLRKATPSGETYTTATFNVYGATAFSPRKIAVSGGYIAVAGQLAGSSADLRLLRVVGGTPELQDTSGFVEKYYHRAPSGYAQPVGSAQKNVGLVTQGGKTYLFYSAWGLGDVYELSDAPRITSMTPLTGDPSGGIEVSIYGSGFTVASTVTFDGITASSTFVSDALMTAISPSHVNGSVDVVVSATGEDPMTAPKQFTYAFPAPANLAAVATDATTVSITWSAVPGATRYEVARLSSNLPQLWTVIGIVSSTSQADVGAAEKTYLYRVRAGDATTFSGLSSIDAVTMMNPDSDTVVAGSIIKSVDLTNLRTRVNGARSIAGLSIPSYTDPTPTLVSAIHITELRTRLTQARTALGLSTPAFTDASLTGIPVKAVHFNELLDLMR
jgi:hypothetical protein